LAIYHYRYIVESVYFYTIMKHRRDINLCVLWFASLCRTVRYSTRLCWRRWKLHGKLFYLCFCYVAFVVDVSFIVLFWTCCS